MSDIVGNISKGLTDKAGELIAKGLKAGDSVADLQQVLNDFSAGKVTAVDLAKALNEQERRQRGRR